MSQQPPYPKRLIEVDLPIKRISEHARREKSIRHGHISTLHIWWARRPLAACRAVICAALWPDPADPVCPQKFRDDASRLMNQFAQKASTDKEFAEHCSPDNWVKWQTLVRNGGLDPKNDDHWNVLRNALLDFIADFSNWDNSTVPEYLVISRALTQSAHEALGGAPGTKPLVVDPFAGGGSIPLEALRVGADAFATDLNPVAVLLNKVVLEYIPKYGQRLADEVLKWGGWMKTEAEKELGCFYPIDHDGSTPMAYLWARTIQCEGPGCGAEVPLLRSLWLAKRGNRSVGLRLLPDRKEKSVDFEIVANVSAKDLEFGTTRRGSTTCPVCGFTTPVESVRTQLSTRKGGGRDARLLCVVTGHPSEEGRFYRLPSKTDLEAEKKAAHELENRRRQHNDESTSLVPEEEISLNEIRRISVPVYGMTSWMDLFTSRQLLTLTTLSRLVRDIGKQLASGRDGNLATAIQILLALIVDRQANTLTSSSRWNTAGEKIEGVFSRQAIAFVGDFAEANPFSGATGDLDGAINWVVEVCRSCAGANLSPGRAEQASATNQPLPDDVAQAVITDPPYYDSVPYAYLSDLFYVWLRRSLMGTHLEVLRGEYVPKEAEIVVDRPHKLSQSTKDVKFYEEGLAQAFAESRRILQQQGIATIVFASKTTASWEAILRAAVESGWILTGSWPIDTEMQARIAAQGQARLASSIHLVCRPREECNSSGDVNAIGDWRDVIAELPKRIHEWMPRLRNEGVVGADAIFACLGPALEIFSRYSRVEKASGESVSLKEYLEYVWAAVAKEALNMIFEGADATGFEEDARLTAMWLWTLSPGTNGNGAASNEPEGEEEGEESTKKTKVAGYVLEYDAARKIAQGLGAHLERLTSLVEIKGETACLLPVSERARHLFGKDEGAAPTKRKAKPKQLSFADVLDEAEQDGGWGEKNAPKVGSTVLDRIHQSMILFAAGRNEALKRFLVTDGAGQDQRFWRLAQALSALYPPGTDERRWVEGVMARKKGLGF